MARFVKIEDVKFGDVVWVEGAEFEVINAVYGPTLGARRDAGFLVALKGEDSNKLACVSLGAVMVVNEPMN